MNTLRIARLGYTAVRAPAAHLRLFSVATRRMAEGDTGGIRARGQQGADSWTRREKAAEDMYIKAREKEIMQLLKEKIAKQEEVLAKDRAMLVVMEDQYGNAAEERRI